MGGSRCLNAELGNGLDQLSGSNSKGMGKLDYVDEAYVPLAPFNPTHVVPVKVGQFRELLL